MAHGADALGTLGSSPHVGQAELTVLLDVIAERLSLPVDRLFAHGEPDRLATATMALLRRDRIPIETLETWVSRLGQIARRQSTNGDPYLVKGNTEAFLRALYLQLALGPRPPVVRADLLLLLVDELRTTNPETLQSSSR